MLIAVQSGTPPRIGAPPVGIFVCEHGAAKSVIATAYFNKMAADRHLPYRAAFRGVNPQDELSARAIEGLRADGVTIPVEKPAGITDQDVRDATYVFAIGCPLPDHARRSEKAHSWSDVPDDKGYGQTDAIVQHVTQLLDNLSRVR